MTTSHAADLWLGALARASRSDRTVGTYRALLDKLADAYPSVDVDELTATQLRRFLDGQAVNARTGKRKADSTIGLNVTIINEFFDWLTKEGVCRANPTRRNGYRIIERPRLVRPEENDNVVTVTSAEVERLLAEADAGGIWGERIALYTLAYLGPRRHALALARISDYDQLERTITFKEKGGKTITKPVPHRLGDLLDAALAAGVYEQRDDWLVPNSPDAPVKARRDVRDDRIIWRLVKAVGGRAGVETHVHALRAAFAVFFLENKPNQVAALQTLMGHKSIDTTFVYLRRLNRRQSMEVVRDLDWSPSSPPVVASPDANGFPQIAGISLASSGVVGERGFEPLFPSRPMVEPSGSQSDGAAPLDEALRGLIPRPAEVRE